MNAKFLLFKASKWKQEPLKSLRVSFLYRLAGSSSILFTLQKVLNSREREYAEERRHFLRNYLRYFSKMLTENNQK